ncbi:MAG TPA: hypothetical protein VGL83_08830 [Stellaceae bacterium]
MKSGWKFLVLSALGLGLAACAAPYGYNEPYATYSYAAPYPDDFYSPVYGGIVWGAGSHRDWDHHGWNHHGSMNHRAASRPAGATRHQSHGGWHHA